MIVGDYMKNRLQNLLQDRKTLYLVLGIAIVSVFTLSIAYASLSTTLIITGSTTVEAASWDVIIEYAEFTTNIPNVSTNMPTQTTSYNVNDYKVVPLAGTPSIPNGECRGIYDCISAPSHTSISFSTEPLSKPGDFKAISLDIMNRGDIDAELDGFVLNGISDEQDVYLDYYILYKDGNTPKSGDLLEKGTTERMILVIEFDDSITASQLPTTEQSLNLTFSLNYVQAN